MNQLCKTKRPVRIRQRGFSLLETVIACAVLLIGITGLMSLFTVAALRNANQGEDATRTTEYAQDKMEQLMTLGFSDSTSDTTRNPTCIASLYTTPVCTPTIAGQTNTGLGSGALGATYGGIDSSNAVSGYVDYVDGNGNYGVTSAGAQYIRQWQIANNSLGTIKTVTVSVSSLRSLAKISGAGPKTVLISQKTNF